MSSTTRSLINALRVLDSEIQSEDGVANAVVAEAANRLEEQQERIKRLEEELNRSNNMYRKLNIHSMDLVDRIRRLEDALRDIANQDFRGGRSTESEIAFRALEGEK